MDGETMKRLIQENTYGGDKMGVRTEHAHRPRKELPAMACQNGIKMEWEHRFDIYPSKISIQMTDGKWVEYEAKIRQPAYQGPELPETTPWDRIRKYGKKSR